MLTLKKFTSHYLVGGYGGYNFVKIVDHFFQKIFPPHQGEGVYFQSNTLWVLTICIAPLSFLSAEISRSHSTLSAVLSLAFISIFVLAFNFLINETPTLLLVFQKYLPDSHQIRFMNLMEYLIHKTNIFKEIFNY